MIQPDFRAISDTEVVLPTYCEASSENQPTLWVTYLLLILSNKDLIPFFLSIQSELENISLADAQNNINSSKALRKRIEEEDAR